MDRIKLKVFGLSYSSMSQTGAYALILAEENDAFRIPIIIGIAEAQSIAIQMEHLHSQRPLTHDLMKSLADSLGVVLEETTACTSITMMSLLYSTSFTIPAISSR